MSNQGTAYAIACAIYAGNGPGSVIVDIDATSERLYDTLNSSTYHDDDTKAELYAILAETLTAGTSFAGAVVIIEAALNKVGAYCG